MRINWNILIDYSFLVLFSSFLLLGCGTTKNAVSFNDVKKGERLDKVEEITVEKFLQIWINNTYPVKIDINCHELNRDTNFTYFGKNNLNLFNSDPELFKVRNDLLKRHLGNYSQIDGQLIRQEFWEKIIPKEDRDIWKNTHCSSGSSRPTFTYELQAHKIKIGLLWKVKCDGKVILENNYNGYYNIEKREIEK